MDRSRSRDACADKAELLAALARPLRVSGATSATTGTRSPTASQDLSWRPAGGYVLHLRDSAGRAARARREWHTLLDVLREAPRYWKARGKTFVAFVDDARSCRHGRRAPARAVQGADIGAGGRSYARRCEVLMLERADRPGFWQSVTGSQNAGETLEQTAVRELREETGIDAARYAWSTGASRTCTRSTHTGVTAMRRASRTTPSTFSGSKCRSHAEVTLAPREHLAYAWLPWREAAERAFSWSNAEAIRELPERLAAARGNAGGNLAAEACRVACRSALQRSGFFGALW